MVALKTAPLLASSCAPLPPQSVAGATTEPCQLNMLFASPVGFQSEPATALYEMLPSRTVNVSIVPGGNGTDPAMHLPVMLTFAEIVMGPVKLVLKLYPQ